MPAPAGGAILNLMAARRLIVEFDAETPPAGHVIGPDGEAVAFSGWTELAAVLVPARSDDDDEEDGE